MLHFFKPSLFLLIFFFVGQSFAQTCTIDLSKEFQTIRGFGGMNHTTWIKDLNEDNREKTFGNEPGEMGLSILRIHLDPNPDKFSMEIPTALHAVKKGAIVFATPWNAPDAILDKNATQSKVDPSRYEEYTTHLNSFNSYMTNNGVQLYAISVQNEPDWGEWTRWTSAEMVDYMKNYAQKINNRVIAPESFQFKRTFTDPILNDARAAENLDIVGGHIYGGGLFDYPLARTKGKEVWMTEHLLGSDDGDTNNWDLALTFGKEISDCMMANFNAYVWWYIRRFYGLINDDGNITDKGYVISQYSKFVRPGAIRVSASVSSAPNIDVTAYKTDTSIAIVVINRNSTNKTLNFALTGGAFAQCTQFTTSATKKLVNDGELTISNNSFTATIDAFSVTTFTSNPYNGGKHGNITPIAIAGDDMIIADSLGTGSTKITLDGSRSSDADGEIANYSWSLNGQQFAWEAKPELTIGIGTYDLVLAVTDNDGTMGTDTLHVTMKSTRSTEIWIEAESVTIGPNWQKSADVNASKGEYVVTKDGFECLTEASTNTNDHLVYNFTTTESGSYKIWGRVITPNANDDSYWVKVDDLDWTLWNGIPAGSDWHWDDVHNQSNDNAVFYELEPGNHKLSICMREDGAKLDKILIANTGVIPTNLGSTQKIELTKNNEPNIVVYPNPSKGIVQIEWTDGFNTLNVINLQGQLVVVKHYANAIESVSEKFNLDPGIYLILIHNQNTMAHSKFIIEK